MKQPRFKKKDGVIFKLLKKDSVQSFFATPSRDNSIKEASEKT